MAWASQKYDVKLMGAVTKCFRKWQAQAASQDKIVIKVFCHCLANHLFSETDLELPSKPGTYQIR